MKHRSPTNSHPAENLQLRANYLDKHRHDEAHRYICEVVPAERVKRDWSPLWGGIVPNKSKCIDADDPHHVFGSRKGRWDLWSNLIAVSRPSHEWIEAHPIEGLIVCLYAKWVKSITGNPEDFDLDELHKASGYVFPSYIETLNVSGRAAEMKSEMVEFFTGV